MKIFLRFALLLCGVPAFPQFTVTPNNSANALAQAIAGSGLTVFNASLSCGANASGTFVYNGSDVAISKGVILCTGAATDLANAGPYFCDVMNGNNFADPNLTAIEPNAINDVCMLECDVVAMYANININFIFGSEEYPNYVGSFNDAFGFFLTGPNPAGGQYNGTNIGALPNGIPVSINNVNAGVNSSYFHNNYTTPNATVAYDGYTTLITSTAPIYADSTYHMKIAIADALDEAYDSGILIQDSLFISKPNTTALTQFAAKTFRISPNPARDVVHIEMPAGEATKVEVLNIVGEKVAAKFNAADKTVDVQSLANGVYTVLITDKLGNVSSAKKE